VIVPQRSARIDHPDLDAVNVAVHGVGHLSLPVSGRVVHQICTSLVLSGTTAFRADVPGRMGAVG